MTGRSSDNNKPNDIYKRYPKENLFVEIKKRSKIELDQQIAYKELQKTSKKSARFQNDDRDVFNILIDKAFKDILSSPEIDVLRDAICSQPSRLYCQFDSETPIDVNCTSVAQLSMMREEITQEQHLAYEDTNRIEEEEQELMQQSFRSEPEKIDQNQVDIEQRIAKGLDIEAEEEEKDQQSQKEEEEELQDEKNSQVEEESKEQEEEDAEAKETT